jgi:WD40 repeat protein
MLRLSSLSSLSAFLLLAACGDPPASGDDVAEPDAGGVTGAGLDRCADDGATLGALWNVDNLHGPIVSMALAGDGTVVLGTSDGAVKQWSLGASPDEAPLEGGRPSYGDPLTESGAEVRALAIGAGGDHVIGGDTAITVRRWSLPDAEDLGSVPLKGSPLTAIAARSAAEVIVGDEAFGGQMRVISLDSGLAGAVFETALWGVTRFATHGGDLFTTGHEYGMAAVERRTLDAPEAPADYWGGLQVSGWVRDLAVSPDGAWLALGGDESVLVLAAGDLAAGPVAQLPLTAPARAVAFTASGEHVAVATDDGRVALHPRDLAAEVAAADVPAPVALAVDPSGERLIVASADGRLRGFGCAP